MKRHWPLFTALLLCSAWGGASNFVWNATPLPSTKIQITPPPPGTNPATIFQASDANSIFQALYDIRTVLDTNSTSVLNYGADPTGVSDSSAAFTAAFSALDNSGVLYLPTGIYSLQNSITVPPGIALAFNQSAIAVAGGKQLVINGTITAPPQQIFKWASTTTQPVLFGSSAAGTDIRPEWFGVSASALDNSTALSTALGSLAQDAGGSDIPGGGSIRLGAGTFNYSIGITVPAHVDFSGSGNEITALYFNDAGTALTMSGCYSHLHDMTVQYPTTVASATNVGVSVGVAGPSSAIGNGCTPYYPEGIQIDRVNVLGPSSTQAARTAVQALGTGIAMYGLANTLNNSTVLGFQTAVGMRLAGDAGSIFLANGDTITSSLLSAYGLEDGGQGATVGVDLAGAGATSIVGSTLQSVDVGIWDHDGGGSIQSIGNHYETNNVCILLNGSGLENTSIGDSLGAVAGATAALEMTGPAFATVYGGVFSVVPVIQDAGTIQVFGGYFNGAGAPELTGAANYLQEPHAQASAVNDYTMTGSVGFLVVETSDGGARQITLPHASDNAAHQFTVVDLASTGTVVVNSTDGINYSGGGGSSVTMATQGEAMTFEAFNGEWYTVSHN